MSKTATYALIASNTLGSAAADVTFSSIPTTFTDLVVVANVLGTSSGCDGLIRVGNGSIDNGANYSETVLRGNGTAASSARYTESYLNASATWGTGIIYTHIIQLLDYSNTTTFKTFLNRASYAGGDVNAIAILWRSTSAINTVQIKTSNGATITAGSTFKLYGIQAGNA
jgi:hypothetical protein